MRKHTIPIDPAKTISSLCGKTPNPIVSVKSTNARLPPRIHQLGLVVSFGLSVNARVVKRHALIEKSSFFAHSQEGRRDHALRTDTAGMTNAIR